MFDKPTRFPRDGLNLLYQTSEKDGKNRRPARLIIRVSGCKFQVPSFGNVANLELGTWLSQILKTESGMPVLTRMFSYAVVPASLPCWLYTSIRPGTQISPSTSECFE